MWGRYLRADELPARPDPGTGFPRPPHAPGWVRVRRSRSSDRDRKPSPPPGQGPVVAWYPGSRRVAVVVASWWSVIIIGLFSLRNGFGWMVHWWLWGIFGAAIFWIYLSALSGTCAAGAEWVARGRRWVKIYELAEVSYHTRIGGARLRLRDSGGHRLMIKIEDLHGDRTIWDLVYNGVLYSVIAGGARTNTRLHLDVHVPRPASGPRDGPS